MVETEATGETEAMVDVTIAEVEATVVPVTTAGNYGSTHFILQIHSIGNRHKILSLVFRSQGSYNDRYSSGGSYRDNYDN